MTWNRRISNEWLTRPNVRRPTREQPTKQTSNQQNKQRHFEYTFYFNTVFVFLVAKKRAKINLRRNLGMREFVA